MDKKISVSLLSANFLDLKSDIEIINNSKARYLHLDIMDGLFVPNISFGMPIISHIKQMAKIPLDVHLMIEKPDRYISHFEKLNTSTLSVHYEACFHLHRTLQEIKNHNMKVGVAINPHTPVEMLFEVLNMIDQVIIMSVNPGFGGQSFIENTYNKITKLKSFIEKNKLNTQIEIDGGVTFDNAKKLVDTGADILVSGNTLFKYRDLGNQIKKMNILINS